jgi:hypothetical protein
MNKLSILCLRLITKSWIVLAQTTVFSFESIVVDSNETKMTFFMEDRIAFGIDYDVAFCYMKVNDL